MIIKRLFVLLITLVAFTIVAKAQQVKDYLDNWKKVEQFEKKGLTKSATAEVLKIYNLAVKDNNDAQQIKACIYQAKYRNMTDEDSQPNNIFFFDTLISKAKAPAKNILQSIQAELFWQYLQNDRWKFYNRTTLAEEKSSDIETWSIDKLNNTIAALYTASLTNESVLKSTSLNGYDAIIIKGQNTRRLRPTLYDFLAQRALSYFVNDEKDITKPAYAFTINDEHFFSPAADFAKASFKTKDTASLYFKAILLLQDILKFHLKDASPSALIDADLIRLDFVHDNAIMENKEKLYEDALKNIETTYPDDSVTAQASYLRANIYYQRGQDFDPLTKTTNQYEIKRAKELCEAIVKKWPKAEGGINAQNLLNQIQQPFLNIETEKVNVPLQPFRNLVSYKNLNTLYFRIIKTSREEIKNLSHNDNDAYWNSIIKLKPVKEWNINLPGLQDYQQHSAEVKANGLSNGTYFIVASKNADFSLTKNILTQQLIYISNISFINNDSNYYVLNRDNGLPLSNTQVQVWQETYNYATSKYEDKKSEQYTTNGNGYFNLKNTTEQYRNILLQFVRKDDELFMNDNISDYYNNYNSTVDTTAKTTFLFTDRSIYRPGQTICFKGIVVKTDHKNRKSNVVTDFKTTILLLDANSQRISSLLVTSNEFGSYNGKFVLPSGLLNGNFTIIDSLTNGTHNFNVEEYKRPNFYVDIPKPKGAYRLLDSITVTGNAKAYAGNNIDGANVKYRVLRKVRYPIWDDFGYSNRGRFPYYPQRQSNEIEITNGEITTSTNGEFNITFKATPDESVDKKDQPIFYYEVSADVTDINGETRSSNTSVAVAYQMLQLNIDVADKMMADSLKNITIKSTNLNDIEENAPVTITIQKLKSPTKIFRDRYWKQPDQFLMSKDEYYNYFPYDIYKNENEPANYGIESKVFEKSDSSNHPLAISNTLPSGYYKITATTKDKYGTDISAVKYIQLTSNNDKLYAPIDVAIEKPSLHPGEKTNYTLATGFDKIWIIHSLHSMNGNNAISYQTIEQNKPFQLTIAPTEEDRGGIGLGYAFVQHNRVYNSNQTIDVPWDNKTLNISFNTFRDKLLPGANEKWSVKISGNKNEKVAAEMLTAMYDASLDQFKPQSWQTPNVWASLYFNDTWSNNGFTKTESGKRNGFSYNYLNYLKAYDNLLSFTNQPKRILIRGMSTFQHDANPDVRWNDKNANVEAQASQPVHAKFPKPKFNDSNGNGVIDQLDKESNAPIANKANSSGVSISDNNNQEPSQIQIRKKFNETAFFFPDLKTDAEGNIEFAFTMPDALTQWKLMLLAHTKDMATAYTEKTIITQKPLMVQPNTPRFLREGDKMEFSAKIVNLSDSALTGNAQLELFDAATDKAVDILFANNLPTQNFIVAAGQSVAVKFPINIPLNFNNALTYRIIAKSANYSDGEEMALPVLTNRTLVTESIPLNLHNTNKKDFTFEKLLNSRSSTTLSNHALIVEFTSNPAWYAVQALPYLMEYPYECAEQTFNRYYANTLASYISNSTPKIKAVFEKWKTTDTAALLSNLQKNEELKSVLLQETPWVMDAQNENQQKKNIALLFDLVKMSSESAKALDKLKDMQSSNGGFVWFKGGPDDRYITQYILTGIGHLRKLNALPGNEYQKVKPIVDNAVAYLDNKIKEDYDNLIRYKLILKNNNLGYTQIQYLYMRSFFAEYKIPSASQTAYNYYRKQAQQFWLGNSKYIQAMIALALYRSNDIVTPKAIIQSLKENAIDNEELGMYWKEWTTGGYYWYKAPIESQALMIEAFTDIDKNISTIDDLKTWLLKQKQTQNWKTTKATAEACYALLLNGSTWLSEEKNIQIQLGDTVINSNQQTDQAGTGYFKTKIDGDKVKPAMGNISVSITNSANQPINQSTSWGSVYWQYFEDLDKITPAETPLKLGKKLFIEKNTDKGPVLVAVEDTSILKVGDKIKVRIELRVDRDMEYIQMKDMRAACMEPTNVISEYKWQDGLGYYESTKDASTNFFFGQLPRGTYVFEYPMFVTHAGNFSNGITTIQCMYAPEFTAHSEGIRVNVKD